VKIQKPTSTRVQNSVSDYTLREIRNFLSRMKKEWHKQATTPVAGPSFVDPSLMWMKDHWMYETCQVLSSLLHTPTFLHGRHCVRRVKTAFHYSIQPAANIGRLLPPISYRLRNFAALPSLAYFSANLASFSVFLRINLRQTHMQYSNDEPQHCNGAQFSKIAF